ncbi:MAG: L-threonylcarbamoyladenylate synthase [Candidatus Binatia bacterium]
MVEPATADSIARAAQLIGRGAVVAFPTETVYGLGADATNAAAAAQIFAIKARPSFDPLIVHIEGGAMLHAVAAQVPDAARALVAAFWPGPLTVVLPKRAAIPDIVTAGLPSVAVRQPEHPVARALLRAAGRPIAAPSANPFGYVSPTTAAHVEAQLGAQVPLILDGGPCRVGVESTIISFIDAAPALLRPGGIGLEDIERVIGPVRLAADTVRPSAPGQLPSHYAPRTSLELVATLADIPAGARGTAALLLPRPDAAARGFACVEVLSDDGDPAVIAANLFAALRRLDAGGYARLFALPVAEVGLGRAIMDRLRRAS